MRQVGDYLYTINEVKQIVSIWKIQEIDGERYICKNKRTDRIREFSEGDTNIYDTKEDAMKIIKEKKRKKNVIIAVYFLLIAIIAVMILVIPMLSGIF